MGMTRTSARLRITLLSLTITLASVLTLGLPFAGRASAAEPGDLTAGRGTVLGSTSYAFPTGAIHVNSAAGSDSNSGTVQSPVRTVTRAVALAPSGGTIVLRAGTYHESVVVSKKVTIQNYPNEVVWFDGSSPVTNWTRSGSVWTAPWTTFYAPQGYPGGVRSDYPYADHPAQVFVNGQPLRQVGSAAQVVAGTFFADANGRRLVIGSDPTGQSIRASDLTYALHMATDVTLRGFGVRRYATTKEPRGAIVMDPAGGLFEHLVVSDNSSIGMALSGANKVIRNVVVERNGMIGVGMNRTDNLSIKDSIFRGNNAERFPVLPQAAALKIHKSTKAVFTNNLVADTHLAAGLWFDGFNSDVTIVGNDFINNGEVQLNYEISRRATIADNVFQGGKKAIDVRDSETVNIYNNLIRGYTLMGIFIPQDDRWRNPPGDKPADFALRTQNIAIVNNVMACGTRFQIFGQDESSGMAMSDFKPTINGNLLSPTQNSPELNIAGWGLANNGFEFIKTLSQLHAKNSTWKNRQHSTCVPNPHEQVSEASLAEIAVPLPASVASATGATAGLKKVGLLRGVREQAPTNQAPTAVMSVSVNGLAVSGDGSASSDPEGTIARHQWAFGDGATATGAKASHTYAKAGTYTVTLTVTDSAGASHSTNRSVSVTAAAPVPAPDPNPGTSGPTDDFSRTVNGGWGTANSGGAWTAVGGSSAFSVADGRASVQLSPSHNREAFLGSVSTTSSTTQVKVSLDQLPRGTGASLTLQGRRVGSSYYGARLRIAPDASALLYALRDETALAGAARPLTSAYRPGQEFWLKVSVTGTSPTTVRVKTWADGSAEPSGWQVTTTDDAPGMQRAGSVGVKVHLSSAGTAPVRVRLDDFSMR